MSTQTHWRLAFMFDALDGDATALARRLENEAASIGIAAQGNAVRKGVAHRNVAEHSAVNGSHDTVGWRDVEGAIEVSIPNGSVFSVPAICQAMRPILDSLAAPGSIEVMTGAMFNMVPVRKGGTFLSLSFRRYPGTTVPQFRNWWHNQHAPMATAVLTLEHMLSYDQVHVDEAASRAAAEALGVAYVEYDAYDNLTFVSPDGFAAACSNHEGMARLAEDEAPSIDNTSRRHALMREV